MRRVLLEASVHKYFISSHDGERKHRTYSGYLYLYTGGKRASEINAIPSRSSCDISRCFKLTLAHSSAGVPYFLIQRVR
jgi:hypothetical protein